MLRRSRLFLTDDEWPVWLDCLVRTDLTQRVDVDFPSKIDSDHASHTKTRTYYCMRHHPYIFFCKIYSCPWFFQFILQRLVSFHQQSIHPLSLYCFFASPLFVPFCVCLLCTLCPLRCVCNSHLFRSLTSLSVWL